MHISINQVNREILSPPECCGAYSLARVEQQQKYLIKSRVKLFQSVSKQMIIQTIKMEFSFGHRW